MNSQSYKTTVGAFVLGGLALLVLGIMLLGGGRLFSNDLEYVMYFDGSVSGLSTGAPVVFRGVPMGSVTRINLVANARDSNVTIPVYIRIDERSFVRASGAAAPSESFQQEIIRRDGCNCKASSPGNTAWSLIFILPRRPTSAPLRRIWKSPPFPRPLIRCKAHSRRCRWSRW